MTQYRPIFAYKNLLNTVGQITDSVSNSDTVKRKMYDRNAGTQWVSVGETSGTSTISINLFTDDVDMIYLKNTNWKSFTIKYNGTTAFNPAITVSGGSDTDYCFIVDKVTGANSIDIVITDTIVAADTRKCGELVITEKIFTVAETYGDNFQPIGDGKTIIKQLADGTYFKNYIRDVVNISFELIGVPEAERDNYKSVFDINKKESFVFVLNPKTPNDTWDGVAEHYHWADPFGSFYQWYRDLESNGYTYKGTLLQAGGIS